MTGILGVISGSVSIATDTFNIVAGAVASTTLAGYSDGTAGTSGGSGGSVTGGTLSGGSHIAEIDYVNTGINVDRLRIKGLSANPTQSWLVNVIANSVTRTGLSATYTWDNTNSCATWQWSPGTFGFTIGNTYNGNTIQHSVP